MSASVCDNNYQTPRTLSRYRRMRMSAPAAKAPEVPNTNGDVIKVPDEALVPDPKAAAEPKKEPEANKLFRMVMKLQASDLHLKVGQAPMMRLKGDIRRTEMRPLTQEDMERLMYPLLTQKQRKILDED